MSYKNEKFRLDINFVVYNKGNKLVSRIYEGIKKVLRPIYLPFLHKFKYLKKNRDFKANGNEVLLKAKAALDEIGVMFWLDYGTLLGVYRDGKLISYDTDVDVGVLLDDYTPNIIKTLEKHGFEYERKIVVDQGKYAMEQSFSYLNVKIDIFYYRKEGNKMISHLFPLNENKDFVVREIYTTFSDFTTIKFLEKDFTIPKNTELRLQETYGDDWRIPISNWYTPNDALNSKLIDKNCKEIKNR